MKLLLDGDLFCYRCAASAENTEAGVAAGYIDKLIDQCILECGGDSFQMFLTGSTNFRYQVYPEYKANRLDTPKPRHLKAMRDYVVDKYGATISEECEADDLMGIAQDKEWCTTVICSLDKDMLMVPGLHYSWAIEGGPVDKRWRREAVHRSVSRIEGLRWFYTQMLVGDSSDNIKGVTGIGKVGATRMLGDTGLTEEDMFNVVRDAYGCDEAMLMNGQVLWIMQEENKKWEFPFNVEDNI